MTMPVDMSQLTDSLPYSDPTGAITQFAQQNLINPRDLNVASAISSVQKAAIQEGLNPQSQEALSRVQTLFSAYQQIYNSPGSAGLADAAQTALSAARQYVSQNHELSGALSTVQGLVSAGQKIGKGGATPPDIASACAGPIIALAVAAGAVSAGVGAAIVGGIAIAAELLDESGLFSSKPGIQICPGFKYTGGGTPTYVINCTAVFDGSPISPGSANWRPFPQAKVKGDSWWYTPMGGAGTFTTWRNAKWIPRPNSGSTPILEAFPEYKWVAGGENSDWNKALVGPRAIGNALKFMGANGTLPAKLSKEQTAAITAFDASFIKAWEGNKEFWLNGHAGATDDVVLTHALTIWNRCHDAGEGLEISPTQNGSSLYWATLTNTLVNGGNSAILNKSRNKLFLHTGPYKKLGTAPAVLISKMPVFQLGKLNLPPKAPISKAPPATPAPHRDIAYAGGLAILGLTLGGPVGAAVGAGLGYLLAKHT